MRNISDGHGICNTTLTVCLAEEMGMSDISPGQLDSISEAVSNKGVEKLNPVFVRSDFCKDRTGLIIKMIFGLYAFLGAALLLKLV